MCDNTRLSRASLFIFLRTVVTVPCFILIYFENVYWFMFASNRSKPEVELPRLWRDDVPLLAHFVQLTYADIMVKTETAATRHGDAVACALRVMWRLLCVIRRAVITTVFAPDEFIRDQQWFCADVSVSRPPLRNVDVRWHWNIRSYRFQEWNELNLILRLRRIVVV